MIMRRMLDRYYNAVRCFHLTRQFDDFPIAFYFVVQLSIKGDLQENKLIKNNFFFLLLQQAFLVTSLLLCAQTPTHGAVLRTKMHSACFATPALLT